MMDEDTMRLPTIAPPPASPSVVMAKYRSHGLTSGGVVSGVDSTVTAA